MAAFAFQEMPVRPGGDDALQATAAEIRRMLQLAAGPGGTAPLGPHDALQLLHIIQEALTNVLKHARAGQVAVRVAFEGTTLAADITDNGQGAGPPPPAGTGGRGRANMRNRAQRLGGQIEWHAGQPGTRVSLRAARGVPGADPPPG